MFLRHGILKSSGFFSITSLGKAGENVHVNVSENGDLSSGLHNVNERLDAMVLHNVFSTHTVQCRKQYCSASSDSGLI